MPTSPNATAALTTGMRARTDSTAIYFGEVRGEKNKTDPINFDAIDYRPELAVGRWPVDSIDEVRMVAEKTMTEERSVLARKGHGLRRAAFVWVPGWVDGGDDMDPLGLVAAPWLDGVEAVWRRHRKRRPADEHHVSTLLNEGASLVLHVGHGDDHGWAGSLNVSTLKRIHNADRLPVVISAGCSTARFATLPPYEAYQDVHGKKHRGSNAGEVFTGPPPPPSPYARGPFNPTGLGEIMVRRGPGGAVAYIGCNTGGQPCALTMLEGFVDALRDLPEPTLGDCWARAIDHYYDAEHLATIKPNDDWYPPSIFFQGMKYMVFGDPALRLPGPAR